MAIRNVVQQVFIPTILGVLIGNIIPGFVEKREKKINETRSSYQNAYEYPYRQCIIIWMY